MLCKDAEELIKSYKLGSITADNFLLLIQHTEECPHCKAIFDSVEASLEKQGSSGAFKNIYRIYLKYKTWVSEKQKENKMYTKKWFYLSLFIVFCLLTTVSLYKLLSFSFGNIYLIASLFLVLASLTSFFMLISIEE